MFYYISGKLAMLDLTYAVVDAGGVGYRLTITQNTYAALPHGANRTESVTLYTYMAVREDGIELFGFGSTEELDAFKLLITVSGVGTKAAISILSQLTPAKLSLAVLNDDKKSISQANGIGPKTAARIVLELKDKIAKTSISGIDDAEDTPVLTTDTVSDKRADAQDALMALGYSRNEASSVLRSIDVSQMELDEIIRLALKKIMK
jgi:Holliday junction DNA helicase RuvA